MEVTMNISFKKYLMAISLGLLCVTITPQAEGMDLDLAAARESGAQALGLGDFFLKTHTT